MATNLVYRNTDLKNRVETLAATHAPGTPVLSLSGLPAVTLTGSGDYTTSETMPGGMGTLTGIPSGGTGLTGKQVTLAFDGTWEFDEANITGVTAAAVSNGTAIYITSGLALTNVDTGNTLFGYVDFPPVFDKTRGMVPIKIGA